MIMINLDCLRVFKGTECVGKVPFATIVADLFIFVLFTLFKY